MVITTELLEEKGACPEGLLFFDKIFPNGCELNDESIAKVKKVPSDFVWWFYNNVQQDKRLYALCGVNGSDGISGSGGINSSNGVNSSNGINGSDGISWSDSINSSNGISGSGGINRSDGISWSDGTNSSNGVSWSDGINRSGGVSLCFGLLNCYEIYKSTFCTNASGKYLLFNNQVGETRIDNVMRELYIKLMGWRPTYNNLKCLYLQNGSKWEKTPIQDAQEISTKEAWKNMPQAAIDYVRSLPEFNPEIFEKITGIK